jgi:hypothetical protein
MQFNQLHKLNTIQEIKLLLALKPIINKIKNMKKSNWKTTVFGSLACACGAASKFMPQYSTILIPLAATFGALTAYFAADGSNIPPISPSV